MSTSDKLTYLNTTKQKLKQAINNLGGDITSETTFRNYVEELEGIYDNLPKTEYQEGSNITLENTLKGKLDFEDGIVGIGDTSQKSYQGYNLLNYTLATLKALNTSGTWNNNVYTLNGLTFTVNEDLTITVNGTSTANTDFNIQNFSYTNGNEYTLIDELSDNAYGKYTMLIASYAQWGQNTLITDKYITFTASTTVNTSTRIVVYNNNTLSNKIFKPMLYSGAYDSTKDFEPYVGGTASPNPSYPQDIEVVRGKNRLNFSIVGKVPSVNGGGLVDSPYGATTELIPIYGEDYTLSYSATGAKPYIFYYGDNNTFLGSANQVDSGYTISTSIYFSSAKHIRIRTDNFSVLNNTNTQLAKGSQATSYLPYNTLEVVERGKNLWYSSEYNNTYADLNIKFTNNKVILNGTNSRAVDLRVVDVSNNWNTNSQSILNYINNKNGNYCASNNSGFDTYFYMSSGSYSANTTQVTDSVKVNSIFIRIPINSTFTNKDIEFQLQEGSTATTYEPYQTPQTYQLSLGDKELYTDSKIVRVSKNNFKFVDNWKKISINSNDIEGVTKGCAIISHKYFIDIADVGIYQQDIVPPILSNIDKSEKWSYINNNDDLSGKMFLLKLTESQNQFRLYLNATTVQEAKTNLDNSNAYFIYKAITPIETPITDTTLINQLENFYNSHSFTGTTIIEIDGQLPLIIKVRGLKGE